MDIFEEEKKNGKYKHGYDEDIWKKFSLFFVRVRVSYTDS